MSLSKNKLKTAGYVTKRLRDNGFIVLKLFAFYSKTDPRRWTLLINPGEASLFMTCYHNLDNIDEFQFELNDGGTRFPRNYSIKTDSLEVIIEFLINKGVTNKDYWPGKNKFVKSRLNTIDEQKTQLQGQEVNGCDEENSQGSSTATSSV